MNRQTAGGSRYHLPVFYSSFLLSAPGVVTMMRSGLFFQEIFYIFIHLDSFLSFIKHRCFRMWLQYSPVAGQSVVPILQSICRWSGRFYREEGESTMPQCRKCDYARENSGKRWRDSNSSSFFEFEANFRTGVFLKKWHFLLSDFFSKTFPFPLLTRDRKQR